MVYTLVILACLIAAKDSCEVVYTPPTTYATLEACETTVEVFKDNWAPLPGYVFVSSCSKITGP